MKNYQLLIPAFISGACTMIIELAGSRIIAPYLGTTIYTWAAVIGLVMAALAVGYYLGGRLADKYNDRKHLSYIFLLAAFCTLIIPFLAKVIVPFTLYIPLQFASIISSLVLVPASIFYGMVSPYVIKLLSKQGEEGKTSGSVFSISTAGSIVGTLGAGFIIIPNVPLSAIFVAVAVAMLICAFVIYRLHIPELIVLLVVALPILSIGFSPSLKGLDGTIIYQKSTEYYEISVVNMSVSKNNSFILLFLDDSLSSAVQADGSFVFDYMKKTREVYELVPDAKRALVLGAAAGNQVKDLRQYYPDAVVDGVEIDKQTIDIGKKYFFFETDNKTNIHIGDARRYLKTHNHTYDLVVVDTFRGYSAPHHLTTVEFLDDLKSRMAKDGVVIINIITTPEGEHSRYFHLMHNTYSSKFANVLLFPLEKNNPKKLQNVVIVASDKNVSAFKDIHASELYSLQATNEVLTDDLNPIDVLVPPVHLDR